MVKINGMWRFGPTNTGFFFAAFLFTLFVDILVRVWILPYVLPQLHAGAGFMIGGDALGFHEKAIALAKSIQENGWSQWQLKPYATLDAPVAWASAIYVIFGEDPLFLMPFNALIHATAALLLVHIMNYVLEDRKAAMLAALPFLLFPTAVYWHSQLHKDGVFVLGNYLFLFGWLMVVCSKRMIHTHFLGASVCVCVGLFCVWWTRSYFVLVLSASSTILFAVCTTGLMISKYRLRLEWQHVVGRAAWMIAVCAVILGILMLSQRVSYLKETSRSFVGSIETPAAVETPLSHCTWKPTKWIPKRIDDFAFSLAITRGGYFSPVYSSAGSTLDRHICIDGVDTLALYLPRAVQIALFAPFPVHWFENGAQGGRAMRLISGGEMLIVYAAIFGGLMVLLRYQPMSLPLYVIGAFALPALVLYSVVTPNLGTLHRMRYGFLMLIVGTCIGLVARHFLTRRHSKCKAV